MKWENLTLKGALAFFLVCVSAFMVLVWMFKTLPTTDAGALALLASFVTMFIKIAADATGYQFTSSSGSDKKDDTNAKVATALADKVPVASGTPAAVRPWWSVLTEAEKTALSNAAMAEPPDVRVRAFAATAATGHASPEDLTYLVGRNLLTQERAAAIQAAT